MDRHALFSTSTGLRNKTSGDHHNNRGPFRRPPWILAFSLCLWLTACNTFGQAEETPFPTQNVTQAYETVAANLTAAVARMPTGTRTPTVDVDATLTPTLTPTSTLTPTPTIVEPPLSPTPLCDRAAAGTPLDLTIPDDTRLSPGEPFTKVWGLVNVGSCPWTRDYRLVWISGDMLSAPATIPLAAKTNPGEKVTLTIDMIAPTTPGTYQSNWKLQNPAGLLFGIGPFGEAAIWVRIIVDDTVAATATPSRTPETTPNPSPTPGAAGAVSLQPGEGIDLDAPRGSASGVSDLVFDLLGGESPWLIPQPDVSLSIFGGSEPGLDDCQAAPLSAAPIPVDSLSLGFYLCYQTDLGHHGRARLLAFDSEDLFVNLDYLTWVP